MKLSISELLLTSHKKSLLEEVAAHPEYRDQLLDLLLNAENPLAWRAGWLLFDCTPPNDPLILPKIDHIIDILPQKMQSQQRELLKLLFKMDLTEHQMGRVFNIASSFWLNPKKQPSVRMYSFRWMLKIAEVHKELLPEVLLLAESPQTQNLSPGVKHSVGLLLKNLRK